MGGDWLLGGDFRAGRYSGNLAFAEAEGGVLQVTGGPVFARLLFFEVAQFEPMLTGAAFAFFFVVAVWWVKSISLSSSGGPGVGEIRIACRCLSSAAHEDYRLVRVARRI